MKINLKNHLKLCLIFSKLSTEVPAYSDTLGTWEKCHCNQIVTVTRGSLVTNQSFGTCQKCHCKRGVTVNSVNVSGEICSFFSLFLFVRCIFRGGAAAIHPSHQRGSTPTPLFTNCPSSRQNFPVYHITSGLDFKL